MSNIEIIICNHLRHPFSQAFFSYLKGHTSLNEFHEEMIRIESSYKSQYYQHELKDRDLWFKFHKDDTGATTIDELIDDLSTGSINRPLRIEQMRNCIDLNSCLHKTDLYIYFS